MPKQSVVDAAHVVYTDHSIPRVPRVQPPERAEDVATAPLIAFNAVRANSRDLGLAYAIVALREQNAVYRERAFELLRRAQEENPDDPQTLSYLADLYRGRSMDREAISLYEKLLTVDPASASALSALGAREMETRALPGSDSLLAEGARDQPRAAAGKGEPCGRADP